MFEKTEIRRTKMKILVRLCLNDGDTVEGDVFVQKGQRIQDLLNDERAFLPLDLGEGSMTLIAKTAIARADTIGQAKPVSDNPYETLRVPPKSSNTEVREAWMKRLKSAHPDRLMALQLDEEILTAARRASQRINAAYDAIVRERRKKGAA